MEVRFITSEDNWTQYKLVGDISNASTTADDSSVLSPLALPGDEVTKHILFDLNDATFLDSSGIGWLLSVNRAAKENGYKIVVHSVPPLIHRVFSMMRLGEVLVVVENLSEAQSQLKD